MTTLEPRRVEIHEIAIWIKESFELMTRRAFLFVFSLITYCLLVYFAIQAVVAVTEFVPFLILSVAFLLYTAFLLYFVLANLVVVAYCSDHSQSISLSRIMEVLVPEQKTLFRMAASALVVGMGIWIISLTLDPATSAVKGGEHIVEKMLVTKDSPYDFIFQLTAATLYFLVLSLYALRIFFSIPLVLFHDLKYNEARALSQRAILINIKPMSVVLFFWCTLSLAAAIGPYVLSVLLFPLMGVFIYVGYRHVFIGQLKNELAKKVVSQKDAKIYADVKK